MRGKATNKDKLKRGERVHGSGLVTKWKAIIIIKGWAVKKKLQKLLNCVRTPS